MISAITVTGTEFDETVTDNYAEVPLAIVATEAEAIDICQGYGETFVSYKFTFWLNGTYDGEKLWPDFDDSELDGSGSEEDE